MKPLTNQLCYRQASLIRCIAAYIKNRNGVEPAVLVAAGYCWKVSFTKRILVSLRWHSVKILHRPCCIEFTRSFGPRGFLFGSTSILYALRRNNPALDHVDFRRSHERKLNFKKGRQEKKKKRKRKGRFDVKVFEYFIFSKTLKS